VIGDDVVPVFVVVAQQPKITTRIAPRVLVCSQCQHGAVIKSGSPAKSRIITQEEEAARRAAWARFASHGHLKT
jgi:hypothetical protein